MTSKLTMNSALWMAQGMLAVAFGMAGFSKAFLPLGELALKMAWVGRLPGGLVRFIGVAELCGAIGVVLPSLTRIMPRVAPLAAAGLLTIMILATGYHLMSGEANVVGYNLALGAMAAFVAWGRWKRSPIAARAL